MKRPSKQSKKGKVLLMSFKQNLKLLFVNKIFVIFSAIFLLGNLFLYFQYTEVLTSFALSEKIFVLTDGQSTHPIDLLTNKFNCEAKQIAPKCDKYIYILFALFLLLEGFVVYSYIRSRKIIAKKFPIGYCILVQLFLIIPLLVLMRSPYRTFGVLRQQANQEIVKAIQVLNSADARKKANIENSLTLIQKRILAQDTLPALLEDYPKEQAVLQVLGVKHNLKDSLYRAIVIPYQTFTSPEITPQKNTIDFEVLLFPDNTLIVQSINRNLVEQLAPVLVDRLVKTKFNEYIKFVHIAPIVDVPEEKEYILIRKREEEKIKRRYEESIAYLTSYIQESAGIIQTNQNIINSYPSDKQRYQREYEDYVARLGNWHQECKNELGDDPFCEEGIAKIDDNIKILKENIETVEANKNEAEQNLKLQTIYRNEAIGELNNVELNYQDFLKNPVTAEIEGGVFISPNTIHLKYQFAEKYPFSYYLSTATHEYLHFYSYKTSKANDDLPTFIDEGITDYLKLVVIDEFIKKQTQYLNYASEIEVIKSILAVITEDELKNIYFSKNENKLEGFIDRSFSKGRYKQIKSKGNLLSITRSTDRETQESLKRNILELLSEKQATSSGSKK